MTIPPNKVPIPILAAPIITGTKAKLVPCITGSLAPTGPKPIVCIKVAIPANNIDICIKNTVSALPNAKPATPAIIIEGVTLLTNIARTCCNPRTSPTCKGGT